MPRNQSGQSSSVPPEDADVVMMALHMASLGWRVFALAPGTKVPKRHSHWRREATTDPEVIRGAIQPGDNYGILPGESVIVVDVDDKFTAAELQNTFSELLDAPAIETPRGTHFYLGASGQALSTRTNVVPHVDIRGFNRAYVVGPGSIVEGVLYRMLRPLFEPAKLPALSPELRQYLTPNLTSTHSVSSLNLPASDAGDRRWAEAALVRECEMVASSVEGSRNDTLNRAAFNLGQLVRAGHLDRNRVVRALTDAANRAGLTEAEAHRTIDSGLSSGCEHPRGPARTRVDQGADRRTAPAPTAQEVMRNDHRVMTALATYPTTDAGNAERLVYLHRHEIRSAHGVGWLRWTGRNWEIVPASSMLPLAIEAMRQTTLAAATLSHPHDHNELLKHAKKSENSRPLKAMIEIAAASKTLRVSAAELDAHPWLLNVENGVLDLRSGELGPHESALFHTRTAPVRFDADATHPAVNALMLLLGEDGLADYVIDIMGQALTGISAKSVYMLVGPPGTAKSTFVDALSAVLGPYAVPVDPSTLLATRYGGDAGRARPDLLAMRGARLLTCAELPNRGHLDAELVKRITGRDPITARPLYGNEMVTFTPGQTVLIYANDRPNVEWTDEGMRARLKIVPFERPPSRPDPRVREQLIIDPLARSSLLAIAARAARDWYARHQRDLDLPKVVYERTAECWRDQVPFSRWADEALVFDAQPESFTFTATLYDSYRKWCTDQSEGPLPSRALGKWLASMATERGLRSEKKGRDGGRGWSGVSLRAR